jgi:hypothetical protein
VLALAILFFWASWGGLIAQDSSTPNNPDSQKPTHVELTLLDKNSTKKETLIAPLGYLTAYKGLQIRPYHCEETQKGSSYKLIETFLEIWEEPIIKDSECEPTPPKLIFSGILDSALPLFQHIRFQIFVGRCIFIKVDNK